MRIVFLANQILGPRIASGGDRYFVEVLARLSKRKDMDIHVMCPALVRDELLNYLSAPRIIALPCGWVDNYRLYNRLVVFVVFVYLMRTVGALFRLLRRDYDVIYLTGDFLPNVIPAVVYKWVHRKTIILSHVFHVNESPAKRKGNYFLMKLISFVLQRISFMLIRRFSDRVLLLNRLIREKLLAYGFQDKKLVVTGAGINLDEIRRIEGGERCYDGCFLGRLNPTKGVFDIPWIWERVVQVRKNAQLVLIGFAGEGVLKKLKQMIREKGLEPNIIIAGFLERNEVYEMMKRSKVFLFPSYEEGWGISICEAMACQLPVVAYDLPVYQEVFEQGIIKVPRGDKMRFSAAVINLLENPSRRKEMGLAGDRFVSKYDWDHIVEQVTLTMDPFKVLLEKE